MVPPRPPPNPVLFIEIWVTSRAVSCRDIWRTIWAPLHSLLQRVNTQASSHTNTHLSLCDCRTTEGTCSKRHPIKHTLSLSRHSRTSDNESFLFKGSFDLQGRKKPIYLPPCGCLSALLSCINTWSTKAVVETCCYCSSSLGCSGL